MHWSSVLPNADACSQRVVLMLALDNFNPSAP
jgi:hypothetical protein